MRGAYAHIITCKCANRTPRGKKKFGYQLFSYIYRKNNYVNLSDQCCIFFEILPKKNKRAYFSVKLYKATKQFPVFLSPTAALCDVSSVFGEKAETEPQNMWPASTNQRPVSGSRDHSRPIREVSLHKICGQPGKLGGESVGGR